MEKIYKDLFAAINNIIDKRIKNICNNKIGLITACKENSYHEVIIDKQKYNIKNGIGVDFTPGDKCLVHYIYGGENNKIIIAKL